MASETIKCPSGLTLSIRDMRGGELRILQDRAALRSGTFLDQILDACTVSVIDVGPYTIEENERPNWDDVLSGDKFFALLRIRSLTFGDDFSFDRKCSDPNCAEPYKWDMKLSALPIKTLTDDDAKAFKAGLPSVILLSSGAKVKFRLGTGKDEKRVAREQKANKARGETNAAVAMMSLRISEIDGVEPGGVRAFLETLGLKDLFNLLKGMDQRDCGIETSIETQCPICENVDSVELPIGPGFWMGK